MENITVRPHNRYTNSFENDKRELEFKKTYTRKARGRAKYLV